MIFLLLLAFNLTLEDAIEMGLKGSPIYLKAKKSFIIEQKINSFVYSELLPEINGGYSWIKTGSETGGVSFFDTISGYSLSASWDLGPGELFNSFGTHYRNSSAYYSFVEAQNSVIYDIAFQYLKTLMMQKLLESRKAGVERTEKNLNLIEEKKALGLASNAEVLKAKVDYFQSKINLLDTKKQARVSALMLNNILGLTARDSLELEEPQVEFEIPSRDSIRYMAMETDPLYNKYKAEYNAAKYDILGGTTEDLFSVSFFTDFQHTGEEFPRSSVLRDNYDYSIGLSITVPIFTGFSRFNKYTINRLKKDLADINLQDRERELTVAVEDEYLSYKETEEKLDLAGATLEFARESHDAANERYTLGEASVIEFLEAEEDLLEAEYSMTQARFDWYLSVYKIKRLTGRLTIK
ncbi:TolC family protein [candidate division WOR-3 bacterium]|nr:TolC family protein [candidate division WOR-3 bacterium]